MSAALEGKCEQDSSGPRTAQPRCRQCVAPSGETGWVALPARPTTEAPPESASGGCTASGAAPRASRVGFRREADLERAGRLGGVEQQALPHGDRGARVGRADELDGEALGVGIAAGGLLRVLGGAFDLDEARQEAEELSQLPRRAVRRQPLHHDQPVSRAERRRARRRPRRQGCHLVRRLHLATIPARRRARRRWHVATAHAAAHAAAHRPAASHRAIPARGRARWWWWLEAYVRLLERPLATDPRTASA
eukprot:scaffold55114_cov56-Phaeocystis_antarctica.AAC.10